MDCSEFRKKHDAFIDDTLSGVDTAAMREHVAACGRCAKLHHDLQRALLVARNLPRIEVSTGFEDRLRGRLERERAAAAVEHRPVARPVAPRRGIAGAAAAAAVIVAAVAMQATGTATPGPVRLAAVVASTPPVPSFEGDDPTPAFVASMSTGMPMWPALMHAEEGPLRFVASEQETPSEERPR